MRFSMMAKVAAAFMLATAFIGIPARAADLYCDPGIESEMQSRNADKWKQVQNNIATNFPKPNDFNSLYCGLNITSGFDKLNSGLATALFSMIQSLITSLVQQACTAVIAPIKQAASAICIPGLNLNLSLSLSSLMSGTGVCNGTPLLNISPTFGGSYNAQSIMPTSTPVVP